MTTEPDAKKVPTAFGTVAGTYAVARPGYPQELYEEIERVAGRPLAGAVVADIGAGTGIASRELQRRGARVIAVEPSEGMIAELAADSTDVAAIRGDGDALPLRDSVCDIVSYATSWHWMDPSRAVPEFRRVLRAGGTFAAYWNSTRHAEAWEQAQQLRTTEACSAYRVYNGDVGISALSAPPFWLPVQVATFDWARHVSIETHLANLNSRSYMGLLGAEGRARYLAAERSALLAEFPGGIVLETYRAVLVTVGV